MRRMLPPLSLTNFRPVCSSLEFPFVHKYRSQRRSRPRHYNFTPFFIPDGTAVINLLVCSFSVLACDPKNEARDPVVNSQTASGFFKLNLIVRGNHKGWKYPLWQRENTVSTLFSGFCRLNKTFGFGVTLGYGSE